MTTHLSVRLAWHDRGWDGHICDAPHLNSSCIVQEQIREARDDAKERIVSGKHLSMMQNDLPPCSRDPGVYAKRGYRITHHDPLEFRRLPAVDETLPPYSSCVSPYRWMREENFQDICEAEGLSIRGPSDARKVGWVFEVDRQLALLSNFWTKIEKKRSLIFYYCNEGNPVDENIPRVVVGVGRISDLGPQIYFGTKAPKYPDRYPVWTRRVTQDYPAQGVRIPYQEYIRGGHDARCILCPVPTSALRNFSYIGEHVSDDVAVGVLERVIQSVETVGRRSCTDATVRRI